jgi:energy-converting hydrogenase Eha subunit A
MGYRRWQLRGIAWIVSSILKMPRVAQRPQNRVEWRSSGVWPPEVAETEPISGCFTIKHLFTEKKECH